MSILVIDGEERATLAIVRALGHAGIEVEVGAGKPVCLAGKSRYCRQTVCYPSPVDEPERFMEFLRREVVRRQYKYLLPVTDVTVQLLGSMRESLAPFVQVLSPGADQVRQIQDKRAVLRLAHQVGISCPKTYMLQDGEDLEEVARTISYPAVLKPRFSHYRRDGGWTKGSVEYASDPQDLKAKYRDLHAQIPFPLVQERIYGEGRGVFILLWEGQLVAAFCHRRIREKPPWGGVSVLSESVPLDRTLVERSYALLRASGWQGVAMVEFKLDEEDRQPKLMEVNGRFWGSLQLAIDAGINFPLLLYRLAGGASVPAQLEYTVGARSRWFLGDLDSLLIRLTHRRTPVPFPDGKDSRLKACWKFLKLFERNLRYEVLRVEDPGPGWLECKEYIAATVKNLLTRSKVS